MPSNTDQGDEINELLLGLAETFTDNGKTIRGNGSEPFYPVSVEDSKVLREAKAKLNEILLAARWEGFDIYMRNRDRIDQNWKDHMGGLNFYELAHNLCNEQLESQKTNGKQL